MYIVKVCKEKSIVDVSGLPVIYVVEVAEDLASPRSSSLGTAEIVDLYILCSTYYLKVDLRCIVCV